MSEVNLVEELIKEINNHPNMVLDEFLNKYGVPKKVRTGFGMAALINQTMKLMDERGIKQETLIKNVKSKKIEIEEMAKLLYKEIFKRLGYKVFPLGDNIKNVDKRYYEIAKTILEKGGNGDRF
ncbi:hypothetical protein LCGC14_2233790 [marine sediment metagenome]|uniref:Uncharacterized protein n=1 Tax=marine sediment metagenome TaxID=412755 RepID=A0A0F9D776_9ZZZZ